MNYHDGFDKAWLTQLNHSLNGTNLLQLGQEIAMTYIGPGRLNRTMVPIGLGNNHGFYRAWET